MRRFSEQMGWAADRGGFAIDAAVDERLVFLRKTYGLLTLQILLVGALSALLIRNEELMMQVTRLLFGRIFVFLAVIVGVAFLTRTMLRPDRSLSVQVGAAAIWVLFFSAITAPICYMAAQQTGSYLIVGQALILTVCVFGALTTYVLTTKKDFSYLRGAIWIGTVSLFALVMILSFMGSAGQAWIPFAYVVLLGAYTLYDTSQILHRRPVTQFVAASVDLLYDFVLMFLYILMILLNSSRD